MIIQIRAVPHAVSVSEAVDEVVVTDEVVRTSAQVSFEAGM